MSGNSIGVADRTLSQALRTPTVRIVLMAGVLACGAALVGVAAQSWSEGSGFGQVPWLVLALVVAVVETRAIDFYYRGHTHSFTFSEIPLVLALFLLPPIEVVLAVTVGGILGFMSMRTQGLAKGVFNVTQYALAAAVAAGAFAVLRTGAASPEPQDWLAILFAVVLANVTAVTSIAAAIRLSGGRPGWRDTVQAATMAMIVGITNASMALLLVTILALQPIASVLLILPASILFIAYGAYITERTRHQRLEHLYEAARILEDARDVEETVGRLLSHAREMFSAEVAELTLFVSDDADVGLRTVSAGDASVASRTTPAPDARDAVRGPALSDVAAYPLAPGAAWEHGTIDNGIACALRGEDRAVGLIVIANRDAAAGSFNRDDLRLLETLSSHAAAAFDNAELARSLASMSRQRDSLSVTATHDPLTRLPNRLQFLDELNRRIERVGPAIPAVLFIDLDDFKHVNDRWGHAIGDAVLVAVAGRIQHAISSADLPARLGGDEFAVIVEDADDLRGAQRVAHRILEELSSPVVLDDIRVDVRASIGVAAPRPGMDSSALLSFADGAMYRAKAAGKHRVAFSALLSTPEPEPRRPDDANGDLALVYQPVVDLHTGRVASYEALLRTVRADGVMAVPDELLLALDDTSTQRALTQWVLAEVSGTLRRTQQARPDAFAPMISVNLTSTQLMDPHLLDDVAGALHETRVAASRISLEVSEAAITSNRHLATRRIEQLRGLGMGIVLDDFGAGTSSLDALAAMPLSAVKVAARLVRDGSDRGRPTVLPGLVALAQSLAWWTVAKGIETEEHVDFARSSGCNGGQGYLLGLPIGADEVMRAVTERPLHALPTTASPAGRAELEGATGG